MADIRELRETVRKHVEVLAHIDLSIAEIKKQEAVLYSQAVSGVLDTIPEAALRQKMAQFDAYREDRFALTEQRDELEAERRAMIEEIINSLRRKIGMPEIQDGLDRDIPLEEEDEVVNSKHPGSPPGAVSHRKNRG
jgi:hypothetical protein